MAHTLKRTHATAKKSPAFSAAERKAIKERVQELKAEARRGPAPNRAEGEAEVLAKIAELPPSDRALAERVHSIVKTHAPDLIPRTW